MASGVNIPLGSQAQQVSVSPDGITLINTDTNNSIQLSSTQSFTTGSGSDIFVLTPLSSTTWPSGTTLWARAISGQPELYALDGTQYYSSAQTIINGVTSVTFPTGASVTISGTPAVSIVGAVSFAPGSTVSISGTPAVTISGTPTVTANLAAGSTVNIGGTPSVSITGTPTINLAAGTSVAISSGTVTANLAAGSSVNIGNTPAVTISGAVAIASGAAVSITGTPSVSFAAGSAVTVNNITGGNVSVNNTATTSLFNQPNATIVAHSSVTPASGATNFGIPLTGIPFTTRSLALVLVNNSALTITGIFAQGYTSGAYWENITPVSTQALQIYYFNWYGSIDASGIIVDDISGATGTQTVTYWVIALPDSDINGSQLSPTIIANAASVNNTGLAPILTSEISHNTGANLDGATNVAFNQTTGTTNGILIASGTFSALAVIRVWHINIEIVGGTTQTNWFVYLSASVGTFGNKILEGAFNSSANVSKSIEYPKGLVIPIGSTTSVEHSMAAGAGYMDTTIAYSIDHS
jgi:hypothetical protein